MFLFHSESRQYSLGGKFRFDEGFHAAMIRPPLKESRCSYRQDDSKSLSEYPLVAV
jgi:hypothetical protein